MAAFDNDPKPSSPRPRGRRADSEGLEDARIALRCNRNELRLVDSYVSNGEYPTRSELMRAALHAFLRARSLSAAPTPVVDAEGLVEVPVRLRPDEYAIWESYGRHVANGRPVRDLLAEVVRRGEMELKIRDLVGHARSTVRDAVESKAKVDALHESGKDLERKGVVGR